jgi:hypothetical protein
MTAEVSVGSPVRIESPLLQGPIDLRWKEAKVDVGVGMNGPSDATFDAVDLAAAFSVPGLPEQSVMATTARAHLAPSESGGSDIELAFTNLEVAAGDNPFPPISGTAVAELSVPPRALASGRSGIDLPVQARGIEISIESNGAYFMMEGDIAVTAGGFVDGTVVVRVAGADALPDFIEELPEQFQTLGNAVAAGLFAFGQPTTIEGNEGTEIRVTIQSSRAQVGPVEVELPRLPL